VILLCAEQVCLHVKITRFTRIAKHHWPRHSNVLFDFDLNFSIEVICFRFDAHAYIVEQDV